MIAASYTLLRSELIGQNQGGPVGPVGPVGPTVEVVAVVEVVVVGVVVRVVVVPVVVVPVVVAVVVGVVVGVVVRVVVVPVVVVPVVVVPVVVVVAFGDAAACAGTMTDCTTGRVHDFGKMPSAAPDPIAFKSSRRPDSLSIEKLPTLQ